MAMMTKVDDQTFAKAKEISDAIITLLSVKHQAAVMNGMSREEFSKAVMLALNGAFALEVVQITAHQKRAAFRASLDHLTRWQQRDVRERATAARGNLETALAFGASANDG